MGCGINSGKNLKIESDFRRILTLEKSKEQKKNSVGSSYINKITPGSWKKIVDFFNFNDLKEVGKTNKMFNCLAKDNSILIKFFKKREPKPSKKILSHPIISHSQLKEDTQILSSPENKVCLDSFMNLQKKEWILFSDISDNSTSVEEYLMNKDF